MAAHPDTPSTLPSDRELARLLRPGRQLLWLASGLFIGVLALIYSIGQLGIDPARIARGMDQASRFIERAFPPDLTALGRLWEPALQTIQIGLLGTAIGIVLSLLLGALAARNLSPHWTLSVLLKTAFGLTRAIPALIWALLFIVAVGLGPLPGVLALAVNSVGMLGKVFSETFEEVDHGVLEAIRAAGGNWIQVLSQGVIPQALPAIVSWSIFRLDINIRYSSILGIVGAGGIGWELMRASRMGDWSAAITVTLTIFAIVFAIELITNRLRKLID